MKKQLSLILLLITASMAASSQDYKESCPEFQPKTNLRPSKVVLLYPEGQAAGKGIVENGVEVTYGPREDNGLRGPETNTDNGKRRNIGDDARLDIYFPEKPCGQMVILMPGGGYSFVSSFNEGVYGAEWLTRRGITAAVLKYRLPNEHPTVPIDDALNAMRYCRYHAEEWGVKQIGVLGASAGGFLSSSAATMWTDEITRPDFCVLIYPRIVVRRGEYCDTKENLVGTDESWNERTAEHYSLLREYSPENRVNAQTPPVYIVLSANDPTVPATNFIPFYTKLIEYKVPVELHVFPDGGHGWGFSSEEYNGKGKDKFSTFRHEFESTLEYWLSVQLKKAD